MENMFPEFVDKFRFWVLEYLIYYVKFKMWAALFYVNYLPYFQQWNLNQDINFPYCFIDSKLRFLSVGLRLYFQFFQTQEKDWKLAFL